MEKHTLCVVEEPCCRLGEKPRCGLCVNLLFSGSIQSCAGLYTNRSRFSRGPALQKAGSDSPGCWAELRWPPHPAGAHPDSSSRWAAHSCFPGAGGGRPAWSAAGFAVGWFGGPFIVLTVSEVGKRMALHVLGQCMHHGTQLNGTFLDIHVDTVWFPRGSPWLGHRCPCMVGRLEAAVATRRQKWL